MRTIIMLIRWFVGLLFIFSGLIKANDPLGLSYKMQEFFEVWGWHFLNDYTLLFSLLMNVLEVVAGVAVIVGWRKRSISWILLLLIIFFTFLTGYALFSGKIKTCGCFGDCLPLTPAMSFGKDLLLLLLILILLFTNRKVPSMMSESGSVIYVVLSLFATAGLQWYVLKYLPIVDCLPYKKGNDITEQMKTPAGAIPDSFAIVFQYKKDGKDIFFDQTSFPADFDSTYEYVDRKDKLVKKGNGLTAKIIDFTLQNLSGADTTAAVFANTNPYVLVFAKDMGNAAEWSSKLSALKEKWAAKNITVSIVTADTEKAVTLFPGTTIVRCDATVIKTAARVNPTFFLMEGARVINKLSLSKADALIP
ncbi:MAG TPA: DoxX family protein [Chitinophagaceae bacterium]|nr:DoxX family protein [Chitinophagaceae bacterium]